MSSLVRSSLCWCSVFVNYFIFCSHCADDNNDGNSNSNSNYGCDDLVASIVQFNFSHNSNNNDHGEQRRCSNDECCDASTYCLASSSTTCISLSLFFLFLCFCVTFTLGRHQSQMPLSTSPPPTVSTSTTSLSPTKSRERELKSAVSTPLSTSPTRAALLPASLSAQQVSKPLPSSSLPTTATTTTQPSVAQQQTDADESAVDTTLSDKHDDSTTTTTTTTTTVNNTGSDFVYGGSRPTAAAAATTTTTTTTTTTSGAYGSVQVAPAPAYGLSRLQATSTTAITSSTSTTSSASSSTATTAVPAHALSHDELIGSLFVFTGIYCFENSWLTRFFSGDKHSQLSSKYSSEISHQIQVISFSCIEIVLEPRTFFIFPCEVNYHKRRQRRSEKVCAN
jgi:hypothetical protein